MLAGYFFHWPLHRGSVQWPGLCDLLRSVLWLDSPRLHEQQASHDKAIKASTGGGGGREGAPPEVYLSAGWQVFIWPPPPPHRPPSLLAVEPTVTSDLVYYFRIRNKKKPLNEKCEFNSNLLLTDDSSHLFSHHAPHWCNNPSLLSLLPTGRQIVTQLTRSRAKCQTRSAPLGVPGEITTLRKCLRLKKKIAAHCNKKVID